MQGASQHKLDVRPGLTRFRLVQDGQRELAGSDGALEIISAIAGISGEIGKAGACLCPPPISGGGVQKRRRRLVRSKSTFGIEAWVTKPAILKRLGQPEPEF